MAKEVSGSARKRIEEIERLEEMGRGRSAGCPGVMCGVADAWQKLVSTTASLCRVCNVGLRRMQVAHGSGHVGLHD